MSEKHRQTDANFQRLVDSIIVLMKQRAEDFRSQFPDGVLTEKKPTDVDGVYTVTVGELDDEDDTSLIELRNKIRRFNHQSSEGNFRTGIEKLRHALSEIKSYILGSRSRH